MQVLPSCSPWNITEWGLHLNQQPDGEVLQARRCSLLAARRRPGSGQSLQQAAGGGLGPAAWGSPAGSPRAGWDAEHAGSRSPQTVCRVGDLTAGPGSFSTTKLEVCSDSWGSQPGCPAERALLRDTHVTHGSWCRALCVCLQTCVCTQLRGHS